MSNRTEDSTMSNLRELMAMESQRAENEQRARVEAERDRSRRAAEERARIEESARKRALEAEAARIEDEKIRRAAEERFERDRLASELKIRLAAEQKARLEAQSADLARREQLAHAAAHASKSRGVSGGAAAALIGLTLAAVGVAGFAIHQQMQTRAQIDAMAHATPVATTPIPSNADIQAAIDAAHDRENRARNATPVAPTPPAVNSTGRHPRHPTTQTQTNTHNDDGLGNLLEGGNDPITATGIEGGASRRGNRR